MAKTGKLAMRAFASRENYETTSNFSSEVALGFYLVLLPHGFGFQLSEHIHQRGHFALLFSARQKVIYQVLSYVYSVCLRFFPLLNKTKLFCLLKQDLRMNLSKPGVGFVGRLTATRSGSVIVIGFLTL